MTGWKVERFADLAIHESKAVWDTKRRLIAWHIDPSSEPVFSAENVDTLLTVVAKLQHAVGSLLDDRERVLSASPSTFRDIEQWPVSRERRDAVWALLRGLDKADG